MSEIAQPQKQDLRVSKTHRALCTALFTLLETTQFAKLTVNDLCKAAMVSRATFYMHFEDKYDLLRFALDQFRHGMEEGGVEDRDALLRRMVEMTHQHAKILRNLLLQEGNNELTRIFSETMVQSAILTLERRQKEGKEFAVPIPILAMFISGGMAHLILWWLQNTERVPPEEMLSHLTALADNWEKF